MNVPESSVERVRCVVVGPTAAPLNEDEQVLWITHPLPWLTRRFHIAVGTSLITLGVFMLFALARPHPPSRQVIILYGIAFGFPQIAALAMGLFAWRAADRTGYVLTNQRALLFHPRAGRTHRVYVLSPEDLGSLRKGRMFGSSGHLIWMNKFPYGFLGMSNVDDRHQAIVAALLPAFVQRLRHADPEVRRRAAENCVRMGPTAAPACAALTESLDSDDSVLRSLAARALAALGPAAIDSAPALRRRLLDENHVVRQHAREALDRLASSDK